jgi:Holliday junction resolvasome RuvABC endonuclease subunit
MYRPEILRVISIDPGSDTLGVAVLAYDLEDEILSLVEVQTLQGHRNARIDPDYAKLHGDRVGRLKSHYRILSKLFLRTQPHVVVSEGPFMARHAAAYAALVEAITYIRFALEEYRTDLRLDVIDPPTVKMGVGAAGNADKDTVRKCILSLDFLANPNGINLETLDEHSIDAIAVGITRLKNYGVYLKGAHHANA